MLGCCYVRPRDPSWGFFDEGGGGEGYNTRCIDGCWGAAMFALETLVGVSLMRGVRGRL